MSDFSIFGFFCRLDTCRLVPMCFSIHAKITPFDPKANGSPKRMIYGDFKRNEGHFLRSVLCSQNVSENTAFRYTAYLKNDFISL